MTGLLEFSTSADSTTFVHLPDMDHGTQGASKISGDKYLCHYHRRPEELDFPKCVCYPQVLCTLSLKKKYELSLEWVLKQIWVNGSPLSDLTMC